MTNYKKEKNDLTIRIGSRIAFLRKKAGYSQQDLEDKSSSNGENSIKFKTLSLIERGYGDPKISTLNEIAKNLDVSLSDLLKISQDTENVSKQKIVDEINNSIQALDIETLKILRKQIKALL